MGAVLDVLQASLTRDYQVEVRLNLPVPDMKPSNTVYTFVKQEELGHLLQAITSVPELLPFRDRLVTHVQELDDPDAKKYREKAHDEYGRDGECEVDPNGIVSWSPDNGAYVMAWVWVYAKSAGVATDRDGFLIE